MADIVNSLGQNIAGAYGPGNIPQDLLIYDKDRVGALLYIERGVTKLMHMMHKMFGKRSVSSFIPKWMDVLELDDIFTVTTAQTQADWNRVEMTNDQAIQLQPSDILIVENVFLADGSAGGQAGNYSRIFSRDHRMEEQLMVEREPIKDSARPGYAWVYIRRGYINNFQTGRIMAQPTFQPDGLIQVDDHLLKAANAQWTGSDAPRGVSKNIEIEGNPLQIMRYAFESQTETDMERTYSPEKPMSIAQKLALKRMAYEMEHRALYSSPLIEQQGNSHRFVTGGLFHYVENVIDYSNGGKVTTWDWMMFQKNVMAPLFELGGSSSKTSYCSISSFSALSNLLWDKVNITINEAWSKAFGFQIFKIIGGEGDLNLVPSWVYGRNRKRATQMLTLDLGGPYFKIDVMEDIHVNKGKTGKGIQQDGQRIEKWEYVGIVGLQRRAKQYHAIITGLPKL